MSHYAFDYGGVLEDRATAWELCRALSSAGHKVSVISAVGYEYEFGPRTKHCQDSGVPFTAIRCFVFTGQPKADGKLEYEVGKTKVKIMRELGCNVLFDDNPWICRAVRDAGLQAYQVCR